MWGALPCRFWTVTPGALTLLATLGAFRPGPDTVGQMYWGFGYYEGNPLGEFLTSVNIFPFPTSYTNYLIGVA